MKIRVRPVALLSIPGLLFAPAVTVQPPPVAAMSSASSQMSSAHPLSSLFTGLPSRSGSSMLDASSVPLAAFGLLSQIPILAVPVLMLAALGRGFLGSALYEGFGSSGRALSSGSSDATPTFPDPNAPPADLRSVTHLENDVYELVVWSHAMQREVKNEIILPGGPDNTTPRPTFYLMMGADGAAGGLPWRVASNYQEFFQDKLVNVVTPIGSVSSMQADWYYPDDATGNNKWLTYMTKELPPLIDAYFHGTGRDAVAGISMSGGPAISIASQSPERFKAAASYSGCPATTGVLGGVFASSAVRMNGGDPIKMWGIPGDPAWVAHSPVLHLDALHDIALFVSAAQGVPGAIDKTNTSSERLGAPMVIEGAAYTCSLYFVEAARASGIDVDWYELVEGTHTWGLFEKSMRESWRTIGPALGAQPYVRDVPLIAPEIPAETSSQPLGGASGSVGN